MQSVLRRGILRLRRSLKVPIPEFERYLSCVAGRSGLEIGGPSSTFSSPIMLPIYDKVGALDNCDFSSLTVWADHGKDFVFSPDKPPGRSHFCDGSQLTPIADCSYDFVLSCHNLEHFANPVKALLEWKRVLRPGGALILVLPYFVNTFDHRRTPTPVAEMLADFENNTSEDDLSHLPEILEKHDLSRDTAAGSFEAFRKRSLDNIHNRCLHHHVFDERNSRELLEAAGFEVLAASVAGSVYLLAHLPESGVGAGRGSAHP